MENEDLNLLECEKPPMRVRVWEFLKGLFNEPDLDSELNKPISEAK